MNCVGNDPGRTHDPNVTMGISYHEGIIRTHTIQSVVNKPLQYTADTVIAPLCQEGRPKHVVVETNGIIGKNAYKAMLKAKIPNLLPVHTTGEMTPNARMTNIHAVDKPYMMQWLKHKLDEGTLLIRTGHNQLSAELQDMRRYTNLTGSTSYRAQKGRHDDQVMALVLACHPIAIMEARRNAV